MDEALAAAQQTSDEARAETREWRQQAETLEVTLADERARMNDARVQAEGLSAALEEAQEVAAAQAMAVNDAQAAARRSRGLCRARPLGVSEPPTTA